MIKNVLMADRLVDDGHHHFSDLRELSEDEMQMLSDSTALLGLFNGSHSLYEICVENYNELTAFHEEITQAHGLNQEFFHRLSIALNRRLLNYLSSFRTFVDHQERQLKGLESVCTDPYGMFRDRASFHYDNCFSYRFLWRLRNYVQHCGLPLGGFAVTSRPDQEGDDTRYSFAFFDRDSLVRSFGDWKDVKEDLERQPSRIEIMPHVRKLQACLQDLAVMAAKIHIGRLGSHWDFLVGIHNEVTSSFPDAFPVVVRVEVEPGSSPKFLSFRPLPLFTMLTLQDVRSALSNCGKD
jgi:hypothetical protein